MTQRASRIVVCLASKLSQVRRTTFYSKDLLVRTSASAAGSVGPFGGPVTTLPTSATRPGRRRRLVLRLGFAGRQALRTAFRASVLGSRATTPARSASLLAVQVEGRPPS